MHERIGDCRSGKTTEYSVGAGYDRMVKGRWCESTADPPL